METRGVQPSFANFREIVIYNFDATTGLKQRSVRLLFFVTRKTFGASFLELFICSVSQRDPAFRGLLLGNAKERKNWEKLREARHVKSYLRSLRTFVRRFMRPVSRRLFKASVLSFYRVKPTFFLFSSPYVGTKIYILVSAWQFLNVLKFAKCRLMQFVVRSNEDKIIQLIEEYVLWSV